MCLARGLVGMFAIYRSHTADTVEHESRLEGGVNRANLKFNNLSTTTSRVSVRNIKESE
jgi:hypothetical protein